MANFGNMNYSGYSDESDDWRDDHADYDGGGYDQQDDGYDWQNDEDYNESGEAYDYEPEEYRAEGLDEVADEIGYAEPDTAKDDHKDNGHGDSLFGSNHWMSAMIAAIMGYAAGRSRAASRRQRTVTDGLGGNRQKAKGQTKGVNSGCSNITTNIIVIAAIILLLKCC